MVFDLSLGGYLLVHLFCGCKFQLLFWCGISHFFLLCQLFSIVWRIDVLVRSFRDQIHSIEVQKIALLKEQAQMTKAEKAAQIAEASKRSASSKSAGEKKCD